MSPTWQAVQQTSRDLRYLPNRLMREAGIDEIQESLPKADEIRKRLDTGDLLKDVKGESKKIDQELSGLAAWTTPPAQDETENTIAPPAAQASSPAAGEPDRIIGTPAQRPEAALDSQADNPPPPEPPAGADANPGENNEKS